MPEATYDHEADILYVRLRDGEASATQAFLDDLRILDYSADGGVVGVEFICASGGIDLSPNPPIESLTGRAAVLAESSAGVPAFAGRGRGGPERGALAQRRSGALSDGARVRGHAGASLGPGASAVGGASGGER